MSLVGCSDDDLHKAAQSILEGKLTAFPTETVYGLGANALSEEASVRIFQVKGRPPTDPLICHVPDTSNIRGTLWDTTTPAHAHLADVGLALGRHFWPGPITFVAPASSSVAPCVTGGAGCVGVRIPDHPIALAFLKRCGVPVAAPSANTFGHVSPTTAAHVMADLAPRDPSLTVIDGGSSRIGIESTVVKLSTTASGSAHLEILRRGRIGVSELQRALRLVDNGRYAEEGVSVTVRDTRSKYLGSEQVPMDGPGQLLTHYSPNLPSFLITKSSLVLAQEASPSSSGAASSSSSSRGPRVAWVRAGDRTFPLNKAVVLDFHSVIQHALATFSEQQQQQQATDNTSSVVDATILQRRSLSDHGAIEEACQQVFDALRWVEGVQGAAVAIFPLLSEWVPPIVTSDDADDSRREAADAMNELLAAVEDRLFRAASGVIAQIVIE